jgi:fibronectin-binding autotransporter adhesin
VKIKAITPRRFIHISFVLALVSSLLSVFAVPANAVPPNPPCVTKTTRVGNDTIVQFLRTGTCSWTIPADVTQFRGLIVGGGGGGGGGGLLGGGGGGGGYVEFNSLTVASQSITITVGAGGSKDPNGNAGATNGGASSIVSTDLSLVAEGGGAGGTFTSTYSFFPPPIAPRSGGSGGGSNQTSYGNSTNPLPVIGGLEINAGSQTAIEIGLLLKGNDGSGACELPDAGPLAAGGGGGAGGAATCTSVAKGAYSSFSGNGGIGFQNNILGTNHYWAGGGGGANFVYSNDSNQQVFDGGDGGFGGGGGGGASDEALPSQPRSSGLDDASGLNPATRASDAGAAVGGNGGANTGGGGGGGSHGGGGGLGGNGGSGIVVLRYSTPIYAPAPSSDATLNSATIKGVVATSLGTSAATIGSVVAGSVTIPDSALAGSGITSFNLSVPNISGVPEAILKAVLLTSNANIEGNFNSSQEYNGETITTGSFFLIKITSQDGTATSYYRINIYITQKT